MNNSGGGGASQPRSDGSIPGRGNHGGTSSDSRSVNGGAGRGRRGRGNCNRQVQHAATNFKGDTPEMNGHVFQTFQESRDR